MSRLLLALCLLVTACDRRASGAPAAAELARPELGSLQPGRYDVVIETDAALEGHGRVLQFRLGGELIVQRAAGNEPGVVVRFADPKMTTLVATAGADLDAAAGHLTRDARWLWDERGALRAIEFAPDTDPLAVGILRTLGAAVQITQPAATGRAWTVEEHDNTGRYAAEYQLRADGKLERRKLGYLALAGASKAPPMLAGSAESKHACATLAFDAQGRLTAVDAQETTSVAAGKLPKSTSTLGVELKLRALADSQVSAPPPPGAQRLWADELYNPRAQRAATAARANGYTFERAMRELDALGEPKPSEDPNSNARARLYSALRGVFASDPAAIDQAVAAIRKGTPHAQALIEALRGSDHSAATAALVALASGQKDATVEAALVRGLSLLQRPDRSATQALIDRLDHPELATQAAYGVGVHARSALALRDAARARELVGLLVARLEATADAGEQQRYLRALANASNPEVLTLLPKYLAAKSPGTRAAAVQALTNVKGQGASQFLITALADAEPRVRAEAAELAGKQEPSSALVGTLAKIARSDTSARARYAAVQSLGRFAGGNEEARKTLAWTAEHDAVEAHRAFAKRLLAL